MKNEKKEQAKMTCEKALSIAIQAHKGQVDKQGVDYIEHPKAVAHDLEGDAKVVAYLHDVLEDTNVELKHLQENGLSKIQTIALLAVTRDKEYQTYRQFIDSICSLEGEAGQIARQVKRKDLEHNMSRAVPELESMFKKRYLPALQKIMQTQKDRGEI